MGAAGPGQAGSPAVIWFWLPSWLLLLAADGLLAAFRQWSSVVPLSVLLLAAVILWVGNVLADRIDQPSHPAVEPEPARYTGGRA